MKPAGQVAKDKGFPIIITIFMGFIFALGMFLGIGRLLANYHDLLDRRKEVAGKTEVQDALRKMADKIEAVLAFCEKEEG